MHKNGPECSGTKALLDSLNLNIETMAHQLPEDVGLMIVADHSQVDIEQYEIPEMDELIECLRRMPELESRTIGFHGKGDINYTHQEVLENVSLGQGQCENGERSVDSSHTVHKQILEIC